jgi:exonuclease III
MKDFLSALVQVGSSRTGDQFLFVGDFNTGIGPADGPLKNFGDVDRFIALQATGFTDAWRHIHGDMNDYTYQWPRSGESYRIDHALASSRLLPRIRDCRYSHAERISGVSDHSVVLMEIHD